MKRYTSLIVLCSILVCTIVGAGALVYFTKQDSAQTTTKEQETVPAAMTLLNQSLPELTLKDETGQEKSSTDFGQRPLFIMEWASWCPHCQEALPVVEKLYKKYGTDIEFVLMNATDDKRETKESALEYLKEKKYTVPSYFDEGLQNATTLQVESIPTMFFVNKKGVVKSVKTSELNKKELEKNLQLILED